MSATSTNGRWLRRVFLIVVLAALFTMALAVIFIAIPITRRLIIVGLAEWTLGGHLESLAIDLDIKPELRWIFVLLVILPVGFGLARMVIARSFSSAARGLALAATILLILGVTVWWHTRHFNFDAQGRPVVYLSFRRDGVHKSYSPGIDRITGRPKYQVTLDRVSWLSNLAQKPARQVNPAVETNWFDINSGEPNLWYVETGSNQWEFFDRPVFHPQLRIEAKPITRPVMECWQTEYNHEIAIAEALQKQQAAVEKAAADQKAAEEKAKQEEELKRQADLRIRTEAENLARLKFQLQLRQKQADAQSKIEERKSASALLPTVVTTATNAESCLNHVVASQPKIPTHPASFILPDTASNQRNSNRVKVKIIKPLVKVIEIPFCIVGFLFKELIGDDTQIRIVGTSAYTTSANIVSPTPTPVYSYYPPRPIFMPSRPYYHSYALLPVSRPSIYYVAIPQCQRPDLREFNSHAEHARFRR